MEKVPQILFNPSGKFIIDQLLVENVEGFETILLDFSQDHQKTVYIIQCAGIDPPERSIITTAIRLICCSSYDTCQPSDLGIMAEAKVTVAFFNPLSNDATSAAKRGINMEEDPEVIAINPPAIELPAHVLFDPYDSDDDSPCTSKQAIAREKRRLARKQQRLQEYAAQLAEHLPDHERVVAWRNMGVDPSRIYYSINNGPQCMSSVATFQRRFNLNTSDVFRYSDGRGDDEAIKKGNWLRLINTHLNDCWNDNKLDLKDLFERFVHVYTQDQNCSNEQVLSTLTTQCLRGQLALDILEKTELLQIFKETRRVFEFVSNSEYTVFFVVPLNNAYQHIDEVAVNELNFDNVRTQVSRKGANFNGRFQWEKTEQALKDLVAISFQLVLAFRCQQKVIYFQNMETIYDFQTLDLFLTSFINTTGFNCTDSMRLNYLQRIVDVCVQFNVCAFIEYPGGLPTKPLHSYMLEFIKTDEDQLYVRVNDSENTMYKEIFQRLFNRI